VPRGDLEDDGSIDILPEEDTHIDSVFDRPGVLELLAYDVEE
jgi:hypothetical protein